MKTLILRLKGFQSWGDSSKMNFRHTRNAPTFSGIMGLLGSALNLRPDNPKFLPFSKLKMATRVLKEGVIERDYQTCSGFCDVQAKPGDKDDAKKKGGRLSTEPTHRFYLSDADFLVAITGEDTVIEKASKAILSPAYHLSLGRLAYAPSMPLFLGVVDVGNPVEALQKLPVPKPINNSKQLEPENNLARFVVDVKESSGSAEFVSDGFNHRTRNVKSVWLRCE